MKTNVKDATSDRGDTTSLFSLELPVFHEREKQAKKIQTLFTSVHSYFLALTVYKSPYATALTLHPENRKYWGTIPCQTIADQFYSTSQQISHRVTHNPPLLPTLTSLFFFGCRLMNKTGPTFNQNEN